MEWNSTELVPTLAKLGLAALLGGLIGLERERSAQPAGLRTHLIVCTASCLIMLIALFITENFKAQQIPSDPARLAGHVVAGIGFLGAGAILRYGLTIRGLTTAASIWGSAAIGLATGVGYWAGALSCAALLLVALFALKTIEARWFHAKELRRIVVKSRDSGQLLGKVASFLGERHVEIREAGVERDVAERQMELQITAFCPRLLDIGKLSQELAALPGVDHVEIE